MPFATSSAWMATAWLGLQWAPEVSAHGRMTVPASRNYIDNNAGCSHCLNGGGPCGDGPSGKFLNYFAGSQAQWTAGSIVPVTITVTAHHRGHYEMRVCDQVLNSDVADPDACLNKWVLERASPEEAGFTDCVPGDERAACEPMDPKHPERWYLPPSGEIAGTHTIYWKVPAGLQCEVCSLQWHWWSANSCIPAGDYGCYKDVLQANGYWVGSKAPWWTAGAGTCSGPAGPNGHFGCGEQFWNCADITVVGGSPTPKPPLTVAPTPRPTPAPAPTSMPSPATPVPSSPPSPSPDPMTTTSSMPDEKPSCAACDGVASPCVWTDGKCYPVAKEICLGISDLTWCGDSPSTTTEAPKTMTTTTSSVETCRVRFPESGATAAICNSLCDALETMAWPCSSDGPCDCEVAGSRTPVLYP
eukprot:TRINITY_DN2883_c0_g1_i1.p1 TRINITY_DN2883_c0_g1~~TRINITY_DN2883_c0_g1_i1.p1  ORF type:complete len:415 (-),score=45.92 TRINITY_DN2883_c0_g1_i1:267-1511(-)